MREKRVERVLDIIREKNLDGSVLKSGDNIFYLTGFRGSEGTLLVTKGDIVLITDGRYTTYAREVTRDIKIEELSPGRNTLGELCARYGLKRLGFDSIHTTCFLYNRWLETVQDVELFPLDGDIEAIRKVKEPEEIDVMMKAIRIATEAFMEVYEAIRPGKTEKEIANDLEYAMRSRGADAPSFNTIVASGARAALPHGEPSSKTVEAGEMVIIDFGVQVDGYCSDETCTVRVGEPGDELSAIFSIVDDARKLGVDKARAGMPVKDLDTIVRGFIEDAGYGGHFNHGTGHGVGVAVHEAPSVNSSGQGILEENMVVTIEPGIYIPNVGGVRLEDMILVTPDKARVLTSLNKEMLRIRL